MSSAVNLPLLPHLLVRVLTALEQRGDGRELDQLVAALLEKWLAEAERADDPSKAKMEEAPGYLWKEVFLPSGTQLQSANGFRAEVRHGQLLHNGFPTTPNRLSDGTRGAASHNAWKAISIKRPGDSGYRRAWRLRRETQGKPQPGLIERERAQPNQGTALPAPPSQDQASPQSCPPPKDSGARGGRRALADPLDRYCVLFDDVPLAARPAGPAPQSGSNDVMIISRERRKRHARRCTDAIWDE